MTWTEERTSVNQHLQIGAESTSALGTNVSATKELLCYDMVMQPEGDTTFYGGSGRKYDSEQEQNTEWLSSTWNGNLDYNGIIYPLVSAGGSVASVAHLASATAKDWIITPPVTGSIVPQTFTVEQGDSVYAQKVNYLLFTDIGYTVERKATSFTGKSMSQSIQTGITLTSSPTIVALAPVPGKHINVYADTTSGGLGTTQLLKVLKVQYQWSGIYGQFFPLNRANASYTAHVDLKPQCTIKLLLEADATALAFIASWESGATYFVRVDALGTVAIATDGPGNIFNEFKHDMAIKFDKPDAFQDSNGVYAIGLNGRIVEDPTWGKSQLFTVTNLITAL